MDPYEDMLHARPARRGLLGAVAGALFAAVGLVSVPSLLTSATAQQPFSDCHISIMDGFATVTCAETEPRTPNAVAREDSGQTSTSAEAFEINDRILILDEQAHMVYMEVNRPLNPTETLSVEFRAGSTPLDGDANGFKYVLTTGADPELPERARVVGARLFGGVSQNGSRYYLGFAVRDDNLSMPEHLRPTTMDLTIADSQQAQDVVERVAVRWDDDDGRVVTCGDTDYVHDKTSVGGSTSVSALRWKIPSSYELVVEYDHDGVQSTSVNSVVVNYNGIKQSKMTDDFTPGGAC